MGRKKQSNEELCYIIPVQKKIVDGKYKISYVKEFKPDKNGNVRVRNAKMHFSTWNFDGVEEVKNYNVIRICDLNGY